MEQVSEEKLAQAKRLEWILTWEMYDPQQYPHHKELFKRFIDPGTCWSLKTPEVQQMNFDRIDYILTGDEEALRREPQRNVTDEDWETHRQAHIALSERVNQ